MGLFDDIKKWWDLLPEDTQKEYLIAGNKFTFSPNYKNIYTCSVVGDDGTVYSHEYHSSMSGIQTPHINECVPVSCPQLWHQILGDYLGIETYMNYLFEEGILNIDYGSHDDSPEILELNENFDMKEKLIEYAIREAELRAKVARGEVTEAESRLMNAIEKSNEEDKSDK